jgi:molybdopterin synthase sulfur carrier subunit
MIRVVLPSPLAVLARTGTDMTVEVEPPVTQRAVLDAIEARWPALRGTMRDQGSGKRRSLVRFYACGEDLSHESPDAPLPEAVASGKEPYIVLGAIAGG